MNIADKHNSSSPIPIEVSVVSDTTISSSDRSRSSSDSSADALDDDYGAHILSSSEDDGEMDDDDELKDEEQDVKQDTANHFLVKSMTSGLQVCPVDDLAIEDEKRWRRSRQNLKNKSKGKNVPLMGISRDAESLPSMLRPIMVRTRRSGSSPVLSIPDISTSSTTSVSHNRPSSARERGQTAALSLAAVVSPNTVVASASPLLRKDSAAIRRQYWSQLGFTLSRNDLEKNTGRKKERRDGLKVLLNDADSKNEQGATGFFRFIASWYAPLTAVSGEDKASRKDRERTASARQLRSSLLRHSLSDNSDVSQPKKGVQFNEEAELFYIPLHRDYSKRQRECMWPTRADFVAMVERNLDAVYDEMEREYETQLENEYLENEGMAREETRQRTIEAQERKAAESAAKLRRSLSPPLSRSSSTISSYVPMLALSQKEVIVSPRARSSHDLRFKYLKHLGIDS
ncbi:unnamed protein product [Peronospora destructor]|uniref:Uncharacterized protein n=1 Tax=Peronospora destructor TaxID=86335 RepID=A0AAV0TIC0_9STRA|nr:unnamed protein product [Peronospora destructor]